MGTCERREPRVIRDDEDLARELGEDVDGARDE